MTRKLTLAGATLVAVCCLAAGLLYLPSRKQPHLPSPVSEDQAAVIHNFPQQLPVWTAIWLHVIPHLSPAGFASQADRPIDYPLVVRLDDLDFGDSLAQMFHVYSPDRTKFVDLDTYLEPSRDEQGRLRLYFEPDQEVMLVDLKKKKGLRLLFFGTCCGAVDDAFWVSNDAFVLAGSLSDETSDSSEARLETPTFWFYNLRQGTVRLYSGLQAAHFDRLDFIRKKHPEIWLPAD